MVYKPQFGDGLGQISRDLTTCECIGTSIRHKTAGTIAVIRGCVQGGFLVRCETDSVNRILLFKDVANWGKMAVEDAGLPPHKHPTNDDSDVDLNNLFGGN